MVCKKSIPVDFLFKKYNAIGNVPYLVEYGYFPSVITVYFPANCLHFFRLTSRSPAAKEINGFIKSVTFKPPKNKAVPASCGLVHLFVSR